MIYMSLLETESEQAMNRPLQARKPERQQGARDI